jgi:putative addiction module component (TIGR02574 family)
MSQSVSPMTPEFLLEQALKLPVPERIELMQRIEESLPTSGQLPPLSAERIEELRRRVRHSDSHPEDCLTWEQVEEAVRNSR